MFTSTVGAGSATFTYGETVMSVLVSPADGWEYTGQVTGLGTTTASVTFHHSGDDQTYTLTATITGCDLRQVS